MLRFSRATGEGALFRRDSSNEASEPVTPTRYSFWKPFSLHFASPSTETRYLNETYATILQHDLVAHFIGCFPGPFFVYNLRAVLPTWFAVLWLFLSLVYAPVNIYIRITDMELYSRVRLFSVVFIRFVIPFCFLGFGVYDTPPLAKLFAIVMTICTKSPVSNMLFSSTNLRLTFHQHMILHTAALTVALLWIPGFCGKCMSEPGLIEKFNDIGYSIDWIFTYGLLNRLPAPSTYPCWMISALVIAIFGYIIPSFIVFMTEVSSRSVFLQARISEEYQGSLNKFKMDAIRVGSVASLASAVATWFILTVLRDAIGGRSAFFAFSTGSEEGRIFDQNFVAASI